MFITMNTITKKAKNTKKKYGKRRDETGQGTVVLEGERGGREKKYRGKRQGVKGGKRQG